MADTSLLDGSYVLHRPFYVPTKNGPIWAITFTTYGGTILTAGISVALTLIFGELWNLICFIAIVSPRATTRRRHLALVTLWNSNDSLFAFKELSKYTLNFLGSKSDFVYGLIFCILAFIIYAGSLLLGIIGPSLIQIGTVAPARPSRVYYPKLSADKNDTAGILQNYGVLAPAYLRALGTVDASLVTQGEDVKVGDPDQVGQLGGETINRYSYSYSLTGVDLGLQHGSDLSLTVTGSCVTEYGWIFNSTDPQADRYHPWNFTNLNISVPITNDTIRDAPRAIFQLYPHPEEQLDNGGNISFAIFPWSAHRTSIKWSDDPWYKTENRPAGFKAAYDASFWIKRARPALSCWQQDVWGYGSTNVTNVSGLRAVAGIKIKPVLLTVLERAFTVPVLYSLGTSASTSALKSATISARGVINAEISSIQADLGRLVSASFVYTRNVFLDTTLYQPVDGLGNLVNNESGQPADGAGDFVVSSPNFQTFSMVGLIVLFVVLVTLFATNFLLQKVLQLYSENSSNTNAEGKVMLFNALSAAQLFRRVYEPKEQDPEDTMWPCSASFPSKVDETEFKLKNCGRENCNGHINGNLGASGLTVMPTGGATTDVKSSSTKETVREDTQSATSP